MLKSSGLRIPRYISFKSVLRMRISLPCRSGSDFSLWCGSGSDFSITVDADPNVTFHADPDSRQSDATEPSRCNSNSSQLLALHFGADPVHQNDADTCKSGSTTRLSIGSNMFWNCRFFVPKRRKQNRTRISALTVLAFTYWSLLTCCHTWDRFLSWPQSQCSPASSWRPPP